MSDIKLSLHQLMRAGSTIGSGTYSLSVDGVQVGVGTREECERFAAELRGKPDVALQLVAMFKDSAL